MSDTSMSGNMSLELLEVVERARREPEGRFHSLAHRIDVPALERAYRRMRKDAASVWMESRRTSTGRTWRRTSRTCTHG